MLSNRLKFAVGGPVLELANPRIPGRPHHKVAERVGAQARRVLEVCAGTGYLSRLIAADRQECQIDALDLSPESLALGRRKAEHSGLTTIRFVHGSAADMPFDDEAFDTAVTCYGLHEIPSAERAATFAELARVVRPGGRVVAADWDTPPRGARSVELVMALSEKPYAREVLRNGLVDPLRKVGFTIVGHDRASSRRMSFQVVEAIRT